MLRVLLVLVPLLLLARPAAAADCTATSTGRVPLNDLGPGLYLGVPGGLYPGGVNTRPAAHQAAGLAIANAIVPLDTLGVPDPVNGRVLLISIGMSNATQEFSRFVVKSNADALRRSTTRVVDCAIGGQAANVIDDPAVPYWDSVATRLRGRGFSPAQVQVAWIKEADAGPTGTFAVSSESLAVHLARIVRILKVECPNVKLAYFTSRIYAGYATTMLNPEPYAYESAFAVRQVIEKQLAGDPTLNYDPGAGPVQAPWLAWGPYLWADGLSARSDGLTWACSELAADGTHPAPAGQLKVADSLLAFFRWDDTTAPWYRIAGALDAAPSPSSHIQLAVSPHPSRSEVTLSVTAPAGERWWLTLYDATGRVQWQEHGVAAAATQQLRWDGRDVRGAPSPPGAYWARLESRSGTVTRLVLRLASD